MIFFPSFFVPNAKKFTKLIILKCYYKIRIGGKYIEIDTLKTYLANRI